LNIPAPIFAAGDRTSDIPEAMPSQESDERMGGPPAEPSRDHAPAPGRFAAS